MLNETFEWLPDCLEDSVEISQIEKKRKCCEQAYKSLLEKFVSGIPDEPPVVGYYHRNSNSLTEQHLY